MDTNQIKYIPRLIGRILFYEVNNPIQPIEIECFGVKVGPVVHIYTKHKDQTYDNYALSESYLAGAHIYYFMCPTGKIFASIPLYIKNITYYIRDGRKIKESRKGSIVGVKGMFNAICWNLKLEPILDLTDKSLSDLYPIDKSASETIGGRNYFPCEVKRWALVTPDCMSVN